jgi:hypothetical protein
MRHNERLVEALLAEKVSDRAPQVFWGGDHAYTISEMIEFLGPGGKNDR